MNLKLLSGTVLSIKEWRVLRGLGGQQMNH